MNPQPENIVPSEFDPSVFWERHRGKILAYSLLIIAAVAAFVFYQISTRATLAESQALFERARNAEDYQRVIAEYPRSMAAANSHILLAAKLRDTGKHDEALKTLRELAAQFPEYPLVSGAWLSIGETQRVSGKLDEALNTYQTVVAKYPDSYSAPLALLEQAEIHRQQGKAADARQAYQTLISQFPESFCAQQAQRELAFLKE